MNDNLFSPSSSSSCFVNSIEMIFNGFACKLIDNLGYYNNANKLQFKRKHYSYFLIHSKQLNNFSFFNDQTQHFSHQWIMRAGSRHLNFIPVHWICMYRVWVWVWWTDLINSFISFSIIIIQLRLWINLIAFNQIAIYLFSFRFGLFFGLESKNRTKYYTIRSHSEDSSWEKDLRFDKCWIFLRCVFYSFIAK